MSVGGVNTKQVWNEKRMLGASKSDNPMNYKISYQKHWGCDGTTYRQTIRLELTKNELANLNRRITKKKQAHAPMCLFHVMWWSNVTRLTEGKTFMKISQFVLLVDLLGLYNDKRLKLDRNTILILKVVC